MATSPRRPTARPARLLRALRRSERGQSLIVVALAMFVAMGVAAMAIDVGSWYQKHHQAQVAADAAALAAANCLAHPNTGPAPVCTSDSDTADAIKVADNYLSDNGIDPANSQVKFSNGSDPSSGTVTVIDSGPAPVFFARVFGFHQETVGSSSGAGWNITTTTTPIVTTTTTTESSSPTPCSDASSASQCAVIYAGDSACTSGDGVTLGTATGGGAALTITGAIHSEGEMTISNNFSVTPTASLSVAGSCYKSGSYPTANTNSTPSKLTATQVSSESWPVNYAASPYFTACTTNCKTVTGVANVPPYCTQATTSSSGFSFYQNNGTYVLPSNGNVYCAIGTGTASNPATWNGPITFSTSVPQYGTGCSSSTNSSFTSATFIGGSVSGTSGEVCIKPALYNCLFYSNGSITFTNGQLYFAGDIFDPGGTIQIGTSSSGEQVYSVPNGMFEGENFTVQNGQIQQLTGDGPVMSGSGSGTTTTITETITTGDSVTTSGYDSLTTPASTGGS